MRALNACLDTKHVGTTRFSISVGFSRSLRGSCLFVKIYTKPLNLTPIQEPYNFPVAMSNWTGVS